MTKISMKRSEALEFVKIGIEKGNLEAALNLLTDLIAQEKKYEQERETKDET